MSRPAFIQTLLDRPLPPLTPAGLSDKSNPPYSIAIQNEIADLKCHPLLESVLHLMNDDLFSAHFLLRKMQEDEMGKWLHAMLHQAEGDLEKNAKLWYEQVDPKTLSLYWSSPPTDAIENMYRIMRVKSGKLPASEQKEQEQTARRVKWDEMVCILEQLEGEHGWGVVDATKVYTRDEDPSHKSMVLGEGYRTFDKSGWSDR